MTTNGFRSASLVVVGGSTVDDGCIIGAARTDVDDDGNEDDEDNNDDDDDDDDDGIGGNDPAPRGPRNRLKPSRAAVSMLGRSRAIFLARVAPSAVAFSTRLCTRWGTDNADNNTVQRTGWSSLVMLRPCNTAPPAVFFFNSTASSSKTCIGVDFKARSDPDNNTAA